VTVTWSIIWQGDLGHLVHAGFGELEPGLARLQVVQRTGAGQRFEPTGETIVDQG
jgi:hypothetical protein